MTEAKYTVCPSCEGEGYVGTLGAFTPAELGEWYDEPDEYLAAHRASKIACECCGGLRVITSERLAEWDDILDERAQYAAEARMGC